MKKLFVLLVVLTAIALAVPGLVRAWVYWWARPNVFQSQAAPPNNVALVLGAGLRFDGLPTAVLYDRVATAVDLYKAGAVKKLLMSGDNRFENYNEPEAMRRLAVQLGVPNDDIVLDYAGRRTYDSCYRAGSIFQVDRATIVTQRFHLDRALYLCNALGVSAVGVIADRRPYRAASFWQLREVAATMRAWFDVNILQPQPVLGDALPIKIAGQ